jgi:hypothetical protein
LQEALKPLWTYAGSKSLVAGAASTYEEEPGIQFDATKHVLQICWTVPGDDDFRQALDEMCMGLNDLAEVGAPIEVTFYDADFDDEEEGAEAEEARDDFAMYFVGPTPAAIMQVQRDLLVQDMIALMERHFDASELGEVVVAVDKLFEHRFDSLVNSMHADPAARRAELATEAAANRGICTDIALGRVPFLSGFGADLLLAGKAQAV